MAILAIDFDGVLHDHKNPEPGKVLGKPIEGARDAICKLRNEDNHKIVVFSVKPPDVIEDWLRYYEIPFDRITTQKPEADLYLDDKGMRFHNWQLALVMIPWNLAETAIRPNYLGNSVPDKPLIMEG